MTKITVAHGNGIMPEKMDIKLTISKEAGDQIEMSDKQILLKTRTLFEKYKGKLPKLKNQVLPFGLISTAIFCFVFSFKTNDLTLAEGAKETAVILLLLTIKISNNQKILQNEK